MKNATVNTVASQARNAVVSSLNNTATLSPVQAQTTELVTMKHLIGTAAITAIIVVATVAAGLFDVQQMVQSAEVGQNYIQSIDDTMLIAEGNGWDGG